VSQRGILRQRVLGLVTLLAGTECDRNGKEGRCSDPRESGLHHGHLESRKRRGPIGPHPSCLEVRASRAGNSTCSDSASDSANTDRERHAVVDRSPATSTTVSARIAAVSITDYSTANHGAQNRSDNRARARPAAHAAIVTTRRRTARIGYRDRPRARRHRSRVVGGRRRSYRLRLGLRDSGRRLGLAQLAAGFSEPPCGV